MNVFDVSVDGLDTLKDELSDEEARFYGKIEPMMNFIGAEIERKLKEHARFDWYYAYRPVSGYKRRSAHRRRDALAGSDTMSFRAYGSMLEFEYEPFGNPSEGVNRANGDRLINIIQTGNGGGWWTVPVPPRPYWNNFVEELENGGVYDILEEAAEQFSDTDFDIHVDSRDRFVDLSMYYL